MSEIQKIHDLHMGISYDHDHIINKYIEERINSTKTFILDRRYCISINRYKRYDMSIQLLKNIIFPTKDEFIEQLKKSIHSIDLKCFLDVSIKLSISEPEINEQKSNNISNQYVTKDIPNIRACFENDKTKYTIPLCNETEDIILDLINDYENEVSSTLSSIEFSKNFSFRMCVWMYSLYEGLKSVYNNNTNDIFKFENTPQINSIFVGVMCFLGTIEWFHLLVIRMMIDNLCSKMLNQSKKCMIIMGEEVEIELEKLNNYSFQDTKEFYLNEYCSHSNVYLIDNQHITIFNSDVHANDDIHKILIDKICLIIGKKYISTSQLVKPIQTITNDQYCIIHCMNFILKMIEMIDNKYSTNNLLKFMQYIDSVNKITKITDIYMFIKDFHLKAQFSNQFTSKIK
jgi:hypothetical protein